MPTFNMKHNKYMYIQKLQSSQLSLQWGNKQKVNKITNRK